MERNEVIAKLKEHEAELKRLGVEHLYLFGSTARDEASEDSDVDLFFDHPEGSLGLFELMDVKETRRPNSWAQNRYHDAAQLTSGSARSDRGLGAASVLMAAPSPIARLTDIVEAVELVHSEMASVALQAFVSPPDEAAGRVTRSQPCPWSSRPPIIKAAIRSAAG